MQTLKYFILISIYSFLLVINLFSQESVCNNPQFPSFEEVGFLLETPECLTTSIDNNQFEIIDYPIEANGITLAGQLYLPKGEGPFPAVILVHGGFNNTEEIMRSPLYDAPRLAQCGYAAVVFYKRGTGLSGGSYGDATYDDFVNDVGCIAKKLAKNKNIDTKRIGVKGGSAGGFVGSLAATRFQEISFAINISGPIVPIAVENDYNIAFALQSRGYSDSLVQKVLPLWSRSHFAWAKDDTVALESVANEIRILREKYDPFMLPTPYDEVFSDSGLVFLWPTFRSSSIDYMSDIQKMDKKWLSIYGEIDPIVPVKACVRNIKNMMNENGNEDYTVIVIPDVGHSFFIAGTREQYPVLNIAINWLNQNI